MRLNLGCGKKILPGYTNVDFPDNAYKVKPDVEADIRVLPFDDDSADEIMAIHVFEHFYLKEVDMILTEWKRVLKKGGRLVLEMPCLEKVFQMIRQGISDPQLIMFPLFGDPATHKSEADLHKWCWSGEALGKLLESHGFKDLEWVKPKFHVAQRDMRIEAVKG